LRLVRSASFDPWFNLSFEEHLLKNAREGEVTLFLWQNDNTVVIGRNQNPWRECRFTELEKDGGKLARRLSGGGAVYHDRGNLNFTFVAKENLFEISRHLEVIIGAVKLHGIKAEFSGRNDILAEGRKFSGNAFCSDGGNCYHHGTLLVSSDMKKLGKYLQVSKEKIASKGIESVEARVANLSSLEPSIDVDGLISSLEKSFETVYGGRITERATADKELAAMDKLYEKYSSWDWRYGETPNFEINLYNRFRWGDLDINLNLKEGSICEAAVFSDSIDSGLIQSVRENLTGLKFTKQAMLEKLDHLKGANRTGEIEEIKLWISSQDI
jgi:lipoate-protein ligase A